MRRASQRRSNERVPPFQELKLSILCHDGLKEKREADLIDHDRSWLNTPSNCLFLLLPHFACLHQRCAGASGEQNNKRRLAYLQSLSCTQAQENKAFCGCFKHVWLHYRHDTTVIVQERMV